MTIQPLVPVKESVIDIIQRLMPPQQELRAKRPLDQYRRSFATAQQVNQKFQLPIEPVEKAIGDIFTKLQGSEQFPDYLQPLLGYVDTLSDLYKLLISTDCIGTENLQLVKGASGYNFYTMLQRIQVSSKDSDKPIQAKIKELIEREEQLDILRSPDYRIPLRKMSEVLAAEDIFHDHPQYNGRFAPFFKSILSLAQQ